MCGEKAGDASICGSVLGSPPHVRGKVARVLALGFGLGITPACAGKRYPSRVKALHPGGHPRMCGEKDITVPLVQSIEGSPPHVRGEGARRSDLGKRIGITPACAGKSFTPFCFNIFARDHPRMCGEKPINLSKHNPHKGSPPHVRGKGVYASFLLYLVGITPACAGKRLEISEKKEAPRDHPRMCGEKYKP